MTAAAIILAAGRSIRMGRAKALLPHAPEAPTFLSFLVTQFRQAGLTDVLVVGRADDLPLAAEARAADVELGEPGVTIDVDTPEDYQRAFGRRI